LSHEDQFESPHKHAFVNGHAVTFRDAEDNTPRYVHGMSKDTAQLFQEYHEATMPEVERLGAFSARRGQLRNHPIFPNGIPGLRAAPPRAPVKDRFRALGAAGWRRPGEIDARDPHGKQSQ